MAKAIPESGDLVDETYLLGKKIGQGGMGSVFLATHKWTKREVAVKFLAPSLSDDPEIALRFVAEAQSAAALDHPNVVDVLDMNGSSQFGAYLVMERLRGESLQERLDRVGILDESHALRILMPIVDVLEVAHQAGVVHRDIKPDNIFLSVDGTGREVPKLLDFGIASVVGAEDATRLTRAGQIIGTPPYMSPEQVAGKDASSSFDIWSMGVVFYQCLTGALPFSGANMPSLFTAIAYNPLPPLSNVSEDLALVVEHALAKEREERLASMWEFKAALHETDSARLVLGPSVGIDPDAQTLAASTVEPVSPRQSMFSEVRQSVLRSKKMLIALATFLGSIVVFLAIQAGVKEVARQGSGHRVTTVLMSVDTDYDPDAYESMVFVARAPDGELISRDVRTEKMPYYFQLNDVDPRQAIVTLRLMDHAGRPLPTKIEKKLGVSEKGDVVQEVFFRKPAEASADEVVTE